MIDPNYWRQQNFLANTLKTFLPNKKHIRALQLEPNEATHVGYMRPDDEADSRLDLFKVLGTPPQNVKDDLEKQGEVNNVAVSFVDPSSEKALKEDSIDVGLLSRGTVARLEGRLINGLKNVRRALTSSGRLLMVVDEADERSLGVQLEKLQAEHEIYDVEEMGDLDLGDQKTVIGEQLSRIGLRLVRVLRDECGIAIGLFSKRSSTSSPVLKKSVLRGNAPRKVSTKRSSSKR